MRVAEEKRVRVIGGACPGAFSVTAKRADATCVPYSRDAAESRQVNTLQLTPGAFEWQVLSLENTILGAVSAHTE